MTTNMRTAGFVKSHSQSGKGPVIVQVLPALVRGGVERGKETEEAFHFWCEDALDFRASLGFGEAIGEHASAMHKAGDVVRVDGLMSKPELNGKLGTVVEYDEPKLRVGVEFAPPHGLVSLRPANLVIEPEARREELLRRVRASAPRTKR